MTIETMMMSIRKLSILFVFLIAVFLHDHAFSQQKQAALWTSVKAETGILKKLDLRGEIGYRLTNNLETTDKYFAEAGLKYEINKFLDTYIEYRFAKKNIIEDGFYADRQRIMFKLKAGHRFNDIRLNWTGKFQYNIFDKAEHDWNNTKTSQQLRNRFFVRYKNSSLKLYPYAYYEIFLPMNSYNENYLTVDTYRIAAGLEYEFTKDHIIELFFIYENETNDMVFQNYIYCLSYSFEL